MSDAAAESIADLSSAHPTHLLRTPLPHLQKSQNIASYFRDESVSVDVPQADQESAGAARASPHVTFPALPFMPLAGDLHLVLESDVAAQVSELLLHMNYFLIFWMQIGPLPPRAGDRSLLSSANLSRLSMHNQYLAHGRCYT